MSVGHGPLLGLALLLVLAGCGEAPAPEVGWRHCRIEGVAKAGGLALRGAELLIVRGADDRRVAVVPIDALGAGDVVRAAASTPLALDTSADIFLMGADPLAAQGYKLAHLWPLQMDFQGIAVQPPHFAYLADRVRRIVYWGQLTDDAAGRTHHLRILGCFCVPGAQRTDAESGDWRDKGPGVTGIAALTTGRKTEDLYVIEERPDAGASIRIRRMNRYGSSLGSILVRADAASASRFEGIVRTDAGFLLLRADSDRLALVDEPKRGEPVALRPGPALPTVDGVGRWTGIARAEDGTIYLVSDGDPAVVAWLAPAASGAGG